MSKLPVDLTRNEKSTKCVGSQLEQIIPNLDKMNLSEMKERLSKILNCPKTHVSKQKSAKYKLDMDGINNERRMRSFITNIYLSAANLSTNLK